MSEISLRINSNYQIVFGLLKLIAQNRKINKINDKQLFEIDHKTIFEGYLKNI